MAIYIEGIDLPTYLQGCRVLVVYADGVVENYASDIVGKAFTVPKHGRLVDADAIDTTYGQEIKEVLGNATTIIPASKEGEQ